VDGRDQKFLFPYERRFFHNLDDDAMVPKRPVGRPRNEERMMCVLLHQEEHCMQ
jgi:hypothetical protein